MITNDLSEYVKDMDMFDFDEDDVTDAIEDLSAELRDDEQNITCSCGWSGPQYMIAWAWEKDDMSDFDGHCPACGWGFTGQQPREHHWYQPGYGLVFDMEWMPNMYGRPPGWSDWAWRAFTRSMDYVHVLWHWYPNPGPWNREVRTVGNVYIGEMTYHWADHYMDIPYAPKTQKF